MTPKCQPRKENCGDCGCEIIVRSPKLTGQFYCADCYRRRQRDAERKKYGATRVASYLVVYDPVDSDIYRRVVTINGKKYDCRGAMGGALLLYSEKDDINLRGCKIVKVK